VRCFLAVELPDYVRQRLDDVIGSLVGKGDMRWVKVDQLHLTLRFFAAADEAWVEAALRAVDEWPAPLQVELVGLGQFPPRGAPRVAYAGVAAGRNALVALHAAVEREVVGAGAPPEPRPFHPHVTLGRARSPRGGMVLQRALAASDFSLPSFGVESVAWVQSTLTPRGPVHEVRERAFLPQS
jgi:2'-5' RNA ligase